MPKINPAVTNCEMLDDESGYVLTKAYAKKLGPGFVEGPEVLEQ